MTTGSDDLRAAMEASGLYGNVSLGGDAVTPEAFTEQVCEDDRWGEADARVIAAAVNAAPVLLDRVAKLEAALDAIVHELGVPGPDYPAPVANAAAIARAALLSEPKT